MNILVLNCGSSSIKYKLFDSRDFSTRLSGKRERLSDDASRRAAITEILDEVENSGLDAVGHRVVHGGTDFSDAVLVDEAVLAGIDKWSKLAPLHNPANLAGIRAVQQRFPELPNVAVFDTAFHHGMPRRAHRVSIDKDMARRHQLRRYGFHGTSHAYVSRLAAESLGKSAGDLRMVTLHLGNGASACAVEHGHSTETSMGMTPLDGLAMGTRSGDVDPGMLLWLMDKEDLTIEQMNDLLNRRSGLLGMSGVSNDLRDVEQAAADGDEDARAAISVFAHRVRKAIGAYAAAMGGIDALVITGGIGQNSAAMRQRICQRLRFLGIEIEEFLNADVALSTESPVACISPQGSRCPVLVVKTDEEQEIARQSVAAIKESAKQRPLKIPIAVSARHVHLDQETFRRLFGDQAEPTHYKDLSQPGQYACEQKVSLIGPRGRIDGVRLLAPLRGKNQVEVSRTDEFRLGVDAPVRDSGKTANSAPVTLEGPCGSVRLEEGLICAKRHIHMTPADADAFSVKHRDEVQVSITGGPRDLVFGDVLVRVSPRYRLEMHIDTDEANAAELMPNSDGDLVYTDVLGADAQISLKKAGAD